MLKRCRYGGLRFAEVVQRRCVAVQVCRGAELQVCRCAELQVQVHCTCVGGAEVLRCRDMVMLRCRGAFAGVGAGAC
jgi:hypothetical protein